MIHKPGCPIEADPRNVTCTCTAIPAQVVLPRNVKLTVAGAIRRILYEFAAKQPNDGLVPWRHEVTCVSDLVTQIKVWADDGPPHYFTVKVSEMQ